MMKENIRRPHQSQEKLVMAFGTFDHFHAGHEFYLKKAKEMGTTLIVVIARDKTVQKIKGQKPDNSERQRAKTVKLSGLANKVVLGSLKDKHLVLKKHRPDVIALGYDQFVFTQTLKKTLIDLHLNTIIERIPPHFPQVYKSSIIRHNTKQDVQEQTPKKAVEL